MKVVTDCAGKLGGKGAIKGRSIVAPSPQPKGKIDGSKCSENSRSKPVSFCSHNKSHFELPPTAKWKYVDFIAAPGRITAANSYETSSKQPKKV
jgi:hypothetical protein